MAECTVPDCQACASDLAKKMEALSKEKTKMLSGSYECMRCSTKVTIDSDPAYCYCQACEKILKQEISVYQKKQQLMELEIQKLRGRVEELEMVNASLSSKMNTINNAYSEEAKDRLKFRVERDEARMAVACWKSLMDHVKAKASCPACVVPGIPCATMKLLSDQANSQTPKWDCEECGKKNMEIAGLKNIFDLYGKFYMHKEQCADCSNSVRSMCVSGFEYNKAFTKEVRKANSEMQLSSEVGFKLKASVHTLRMFGNGAALVLHEDAYRIVKIDTDRIKVRDMKTLGIGDTPGNAMNSALSVASEESVHNIPVSG